jgi:hypothetical protein
MKRNVISGTVTDVVLSDCYRMATHPELRRYVRDVLLLLRDPEPQEENVKTLTGLGDELLALSWRWYGEFAPRDYNVQVNVLKATIFALNGKPVSMHEQWQMAQYVAHGEAGKRVAGQLGADMLRRVTAGSDILTHAV